MVKHENLYIQNFHVYIVKEIKGAGTYLDDIHSFQCTFIKLERVSLPPMTMGRPIMIKNNYDTNPIYTWHVYNFNEVVRTQRVWTTKISNLKYVGFRHTCNHNRSPHK